MELQSDVLIIGGGLAGLTAAIRIKERQEQLNISVVDKAGIGWGNQAVAGGGALVLIPPDGDVDQWTRFLVEEGQYLNDQEWTHKYGARSYETIKATAKWGVTYKLDENGELDMILPPAYGSFPAKIIAVLPHKVSIQLRKAALSLGVKMLNKIAIIDLLKDNDRVVGATGFNVLTGEFCVFPAKAVVIANGPCHYKNHRLFTNSAGEGIAAAYRAGTELRNTEIGTKRDYSDRFYGTWRRGPSIRYLVNAQGEKIYQKYYPPDIPESAFKVALIMAKEVMAGRGPIYLDVTSPEAYDVAISRLAKWIWETGKRDMAKSLREMDRTLLEKGGIDIHKEKLEYIPAYTGRMGNIKADLECRTTLPGLWAIGDTIAQGCAWAGAAAPNDFGGSGLPFAIVTGYAAGESVAKLAPEIPKPKISQEEVKRQREWIFAPLSKEKGLDPYDAISRIQQAVIPVRYTLIRDGRRLKEALGIVEEVRDGILPKVKAVDPHYLVKYHEAASMTLCTEMLFRASLYRTESRASFVREDYPERDDKNWLRWTIIKREGERMALSKEPVPLAQYKFKPEGNMG